MDAGMVNPPMVLHSYFFGCKKLPPVYHRSFIREFNHAKMAQFPPKIQSGLYKVEQSREHSAGDAYAVIGSGFRLTYRLAIALLQRRWRLCLPRRLAHFRKKAPPHEPHRRRMCHGFSKSPRLGRAASMEQPARSTTFHLRVCPPRPTEAHTGLKLEKLSYGASCLKPCRKGLF